MSSNFVRQSASFNPDTGRSFTNVLTGDLASLLALKISLEARGFRCTLNNSGDAIDLEYITPTQDGAGDEYKDVWNIGAEFDTLPLEGSAVIFNSLCGSGTDAEKWDAFNTSLAKIGTWEDNCKSFADTVPTYGAPLSAAEIAVAQLKQLRIDTYQHRRPVLKRVRTIPVASSSRLRIAAKEQIYTTAALISTFAVPAEVAAIITGVDADVSAAQPGMAWAWFMRDDESEIVIGTGKATESRRWIYGLWPTLPYNLNS